MLTVELYQISCGGLDQLNGNENPVWLLAHPKSSYNHRRVVICTLSTSKVTEEELRKVSLALKPLFYPCTSKILDHRRTQIRSV